MECERNKSTGKLQIIVEQMARQGIRILGMAETFWKGDTSFRMRGATNEEGYTVIMRGGEKSRKGVGFIIKNKEIEEMILRIESSGDSIIDIMLNSKPVETIIIQIYMPTSDCEDQTSLAFYSEKVIMKLGGRRDRVTIVMGALNSIGGETEVDGLVGAFSFGQRNHKGQLLIDYCKEKKFTIRSTQYQTAKKRRFTWKHPSGNNMSLIDYMLVDANHSKSLCKCRPNTRPDCGTDHNVVVGTLKIQRIKQIKMPNMLPRYNIQLLNDEQIRNKFQEKIESKIRNAEEWQEVKSAILETARETLGRKKLEARKTWMTEEILDLIDKRNKLDKLSNSQIYKNLKSEIQRKCREAKDRKIMEECDYMQALEESNNTRELYQRIKRFNNKPRSQSNKKLLSREGDILIAQRDQAKRWKEYIDECTRVIRCRRLMKMKA